MKRETKKDAAVTIKGLVLPVAWDEYDRVTGVVIETRDEKSYIVARNKKGKELIGLMHHEVEVSGTVKENEQGGLLIRLRNYRPMVHDEQDQGGQA